MKNSSRNELLQPENLPHFFEGQVWVALRSIGGCWRVLDSVLLNCLSSVEDSHIFGDEFFVEQ